MRKVIFNNREQQFYSSVKKSVDQYFTTTGTKKTGNWKLYTKTIILLPSALFIYIFLLSETSPYIFIDLIACILLGFLLALIGFNIMHDACHGSYSSKKWVNELMGLTMNGLGGNAYIWKIKHNIIHHTFTNVDGIDDDIAKSPFLRQCATQKWVPAHRYQHFYMFILYALNTILWAFVADTIKYFTKKIVVTEIKIPVREHIMFWVSKFLCLVLYIALPIALVGWQQWLIGYLLMHAAFGITLSMVFQLAHVVEKTSFEVAGEEVKRIPTEWAVHEVKTTANFAINNKVVSWLVGGLNFQIEHHLFPRVSHIHYPAISKIVQQECKKFDLPYHFYPSMTEAVVSHVTTMRKLASRP
jgi:linoleoyl-CoA desaturase